MVQGAFGILFGSVAGEAGITKPHNQGGLLYRRIYCRYNLTEHHI